MNESDRRISQRFLSSSKKCLKNSGLNEDLNPVLCDAGAVFYHWHHRGQGCNLHLSLNSSGLFRCCLSGTKKCDDHIHSFHVAFQIQILIYYHHQKYFTCYCPSLCLTHLYVQHVSRFVFFLNFEFVFYPEETMHGMLLLTGILTTLVSYWF